MAVNSQIIAMPCFGLLGISICISSSSSSGSSSRSRDTSIISSSIRSLRCLALGSFGDY